jgi:hypothetical protein
VQALGHAVHEKVGHRELAQVPAGEGLVLLPQLLGHLADGGTAEQAGPVLVLKGRLDIPRTQAAGEHLDSQALQLCRPAGQAGSDAGHERLGPIRDLRYSILDRTLGRAQAPTPIAIAIAGARLGPVLVVPTPHRLGHLRLQRLLDDLTDRELEQLGASVAVGHALVQQLLKLLARPL